MYCNNEFVNFVLTFIFIPPFLNDLNFTTESASPITQ